MHAAQKAFSESYKTKTFVERVRHTDGSAVHLVRTYDQQERPCWFLLKTHERSLVKLERTAYEEIIDLTQYGEIVASGWGHKPDEQALSTIPVQRPNISHEHPFPDNHADLCVEE